MLQKLITGLLLLSSVSVVIGQDGGDDDKAEPTKRPSWSAGLPERTKSADLNTPEFKRDMAEDIELDMSDFGLQEKPQIEIDLPINETIAIKAEKPDVSEPVDEPVEAVVDNPVVLEEPISPPQDEAPVIEEPAAVIEEPVQIVDEPAPAQEDLDIAEPQEDTAVAEAEVNNEPVVEQPVITEEVADADIQEPSSEPPVEEEVVNIPLETSIASVEPPVNSTVMDVAEAAAEQQAEYKWSIVKQEPVQYPIKAAIENLEGWVDVEVTIDPSGKVVSVSPVKYSRRGRVFGKPAVQSVNRWLFKPPSEVGVTENISRIYKIEFDL